MQKRAVSQESAKNQINLFKKLKGTKLIKFKQIWKLNILIGYIIWEKRELESTWKNASLLLSPKIDRQTLVVQVMEEDY